jgi:guanylate kinase
VGASGFTKYKLFILTGPSCAGKTPVVKALRFLYPQIGQKIQPLIFYISREKRPTEKDGVDYHFRTNAQIKLLAGKKKMILIEARGDLHGFVVDDLRQILRQTDALYEGNTFMAERILALGNSEDISMTSLFISPFSKSELEQLQKKYLLPDVKKYIFEHMLRKQYNRAAKLNIRLNEAIRKNLEHRARDVYDELAMAHHFDYIIVNHDGEDHPVWDNVSTLTGDALNAVNSLARIITGEEALLVENWHDFRL